MAKRIKKTDQYLTNAAEEAYKVLRTNIQFCSFDEKVKTITITSCNPGEGKTTTVYKMAKSMAKSGISTLIIDADLRKPTLMRHVVGRKYMGLSNVISGNRQPDDVIQKSDTENLYFISSGPRPPNPAELLGSDKFKECLEVLKEKFDVVIIDTPPLGSVIESAVIASQTDGTIIIIESNSTDYRSAQRVKEQLEKANARILGVVLNKMKKRDFNSYYKYNYEYHKKEKKTDIPWFKDFGLTKRV